MGNCPSCQWAIMGNSPFSCYTSLVTNERRSAVKHEHLTERRLEAIQGLVQHLVEALALVASEARLSPEPAAAPDVE